jgi:transcriptional regulator of NAD metabolism
MGVHPHKIMKEITQYLVIKEQEELKRAKKLKEKFLRLILTGPGSPFRKQKKAIGE